MMFPTNMTAIIDRIAEIDPAKYASSRNYADGAITYLSPYISRGVISTKQIYDAINARYLETENAPLIEKNRKTAEKIVQELAWRDYWQQVWIAKGNGIHTDLKNEQIDVANHELPKAINDASTGIDAVDEAIKNFYKTGYMHNHMRMYVASITCNVAQSHWLVPSRWMYANLLDGDLASNQLSWQWVAGAFSNKKYYANQENINKYFHDSQENTFLDIEYEDFPNLKIPPALSETIPFELKTKLPKVDIPTLDPSKKTLIYNYYNLDPSWHIDDDVQRVLLLEPSLFESFPVEEHCIEFVLDLARNISDIIIFVEEFSEIVKQISSEMIIFKEHPLNSHYQGQQEERDWICNVSGYFPSFFGFWKKCRKELIE